PSVLFQPSGQYFSQPLKTENHLLPRTHKQNEVMRHTMLIKQQDIVERLEVIALDFILINICEIYYT
ncbi:hypothetical protein, partial [Acinetobacter baumannii]|uniref:hypothetical protein n=1 Tax=Acinetobacter baumannii TaxID=470 RepID=UPI0034620CA1